MIRQNWMQWRQVNDDEDEDEETDEVVEKDPRLNIPDSILATWTTDSLNFYADSVIALYPVDSMVIDDEPILPEVADSVQGKVDTVFRHRFVADSLVQAKIAFQHWFDSLPKKEQKKWVMEHVTIPAQRHKMDSILHVKDSIKSYKDSVIENTPRVLATSFIPDSLLFKRIVMMTEDKYFGEFKVEPIDTSYNYHFYDYPFFHDDVNATWLGVAGSPVQYFNASKREEEENAIFFTPHRAWTYDPSTQPTYNTKTPHTELAYWGNLFGQQNEEEINVRLLTTQNITPELNATLELNKWGAGGALTGQKTDAYHMGVTLNYLGKRYSAHGGWIHDKTTANENGGIHNLSDIRDTTLRSRELEVNLSKAESQTKRNVLFINHNLRIPLGKDSLTTAFIGHTTEWGTYKRTYEDQISNSYGRAFYHDVFNINPSKSIDTLGVMKLDNRLYMKLQPWKEDFVISKINVGVGDKLLRYIDSYLNEDGTVSLKKNFENNVYAYAGLDGRVHQYFNWDAKARVTFAGYEAGDFDVDANAVFSFYPFRRERKSPVSIGAHFHTDLTAADHYQQRILLNHFAWENDFKKHSTTRISGTVDIPRWKLDADVAYNILANTIYYDGMGTIRQSDHPVNVITASLHKDFTVWKFHFDNRLLLQFSSDQMVMPVPLLALNLRYYLQFTVVKNALDMQIGAHGLFNTKWNLPSYNPELGVFYNQTEYSLGACPYFDIFINMQWKRACIFLKMENIGNGGPLKKGKDYFTATGYIHTQRQFKLGIWWPFYVRPAKIHKHIHNHDDSHSHGGLAPIDDHDHDSHGGATASTVRSTKSSAKGSKISGSQQSAKLAL